MMKQSPTKPVNNSLEVKVEFGNKVLPFVSPFVLSLVSLAHRAPHAEASHLVLQMRLPGVKWLC